MVKRIRKDTDSITYFRIYNLGYIFEVGIFGALLFGMFTSIPLLILLPITVDPQIFWILWLILSVIYFILYFIISGEGIVIDHKQKRVGNFNHNLINNIFWGTPKVSWHDFENLSSVHLLREFELGLGDDAYDRYIWKIEVQDENDQKYELLRISESSISGLASEITYVIANALELNYIDHTTGEAISIDYKLSNEDPIYNRRAELDGPVEILGKADMIFTGSFLVLTVFLLYRLFTEPLVDQDWNIIFLILSSIVSYYIINNIHIWDKFVINNGELHIYKQSKMYSYQSRSIEIDKILDIFFISQKTNIFGRGDERTVSERIEIIGIDDRIVSFATYDEENGLKLVDKLKELVNKSIKKKNENN